MSDIIRVRRNESSVVKILVLGDVHFPFQDQNCILLMYSFIRWLKPDVIILDGDIIDFYPLSRFSKDPERILSLQDELDQTLDFIKEIRKCAPNSEMIFLEGNHEKRLRLWLMQHPEVSSLRSLTLPHLLEFDKLLIKFIEYEDFFHRFGMIFHHGDIVSKFSSYTAKNMVEKWKCSGISGHTHRLGSYFLSSFGFKAQWYENGCLCRLDPHYIYGVPNWQQGFSVVTWCERRERAFVEQVQIENDSILYRDSFFRLVCSE